MSKKYILKGKCSHLNQPIEIVFNNYLDAKIKEIELSHVLTQYTFNIEINTLLLHQLMSSVLKLPNTTQ